MTAYSHLMIQDLCTSEENVNNASIIIKRSGLEMAKFSFREIWTVGIVTFITFTEVKSLMSPIILKFFFLVCALYMYDGFLIPPNGRQFRTSSYTACCRAVEE
ncbi:hypothetical protein AVEN_110891-1 [Araneus ventricosus]|uniref:Uncharacterized protein n=1 Tax=Araneus ventricosus TaxID=182803 RepID=A0A4Y2WYC5_ARAVE|nr:hypothetical protein AVEN_110891-1 [Araneus ventricosus]